MVKLAWEKKQEIAKNDKKKELKSIQSIEKIEKEFDDSKRTSHILKDKFQLDQVVIDHFLDAGYDISLKERSGYYYYRDMDCRYHTYEYTLDCSKAKEGRKGVFSNVAKKK